MIKKRYISKRKLDKAYGIGEELLPLEEEEIDLPKDVDTLPEEMFQIVGKLISFVEIANRMEEENEN